MPGPDAAGPPGRRVAGTLGGMPAGPENLHASALLRWPEEMSNVAEKQAVAETAAQRVESGQVIGIGSGSTTYLVLWAIGQRVQREDLSISVTTSSYETTTAAQTLGLRVLPLGSVEPDWGVDGADEVDPHGRLIKGRGGAMFREKLLWSTSADMILAIDHSKHVERLGSRFPVPVEVHPNAVEHVHARLAALGCRSSALRLAGGKDGPVVTETGFLVLDAWFDEIPGGLADRIAAIPGVLETGLFEGFAFGMVE